MLKQKKVTLTTSNNIIPSVKLIYDKKSYEMLPFVVIKDQKTEKLKFSGGSRRRSSLSQKFPRRIL